MDFGHDISFGAFLTPAADRPEQVVALAQLAERAGLEHVTLQDHPYQPAHLDMWTLLTWVAAHTDTVQVAPNVLNLPLRPPAVVAQAAASLDLLSGGRLNLGLGAGGFWDAIAAMGGPRRTPGESVDALSEGIDIIRALWDVTQRGGVRLSGEHYDVRGAKRGPQPAHDIPIWLGAYKPRMLRLTGAKADGWLPSLPYLDPADMAASNARIDDAAHAAGRDPREIRRLLNLLGADQEPEQLAAWALEHGFSTFILASDDPDAIQRFGADVAPEVRALVAAERQRAGTDTSAVRPARALALRSPDIDYDAIPVALAADAVEPGDHEYARVRSTYVRRGAPGLVLRPRTPDEVVAALAYAREQDVELSVRSGGHGISGRSTNDGGILLDVGRLNAIEVLDPATGRVRLGPGARWSDVAHELARHGLAMSSGDYGGVGVGGLATAGGIGFLVRKHGLTIDHVVAAEVVLADGSRVRADADQHPDLLWALRGAGGNFGIVTALELDAYPLGDVVFSTMAFAADADLLERWGALLEAAPRELTSFAHMFARRGDPPVAQLYNVYAGDDTARATAALEPLLEVGTLLGQQAQLVPYPAILPAGGPHDGGRPPRIRSGLADHVTPQLARTLDDGLRSGALPLFQMRSVGGAVNDVDPQATAYAHRTQTVSLTGVGAGAARIDAFWDGELHPQLNGLYLSFETDLAPERLADAFPEPTLGRLRELKALYDPDNVFDRNFAIAPAQRVM
jgi:alkanesulfonate monooxygenase SsuD/methylene tetrahydromethanopterin reductase-like flavin-dependent oxidoreductase (luciferase family)